MISPKYYRSPGKPAASADPCGPSQCASIVPSWSTPQSPREWVTFLPKCHIDNPAKISAELSALFGGDARAAELHGPGDPALLLPAEAAFLGRAVPKRAQEFAAGRVCARRALAEFGFMDFAIERAADRQPIWPQGMVGSITHTTGFCAAVAAARDSTAAIGLDTEVAGGDPFGGTLGGTAPGGTPPGGTPIGGAQPHLWPSICDASEIEWLETLPEPARTPAATLIFSAKEAFYKCQYPLTLEPLGFHDARIEIIDWGGRSGAFTIAATRQIAFAGWAALPMVGRYRFHGQFVTSGLRLSRELSKEVFSERDRRFFHEPIKN